MSTIVGKVATYTDNSFYLESGTRIKLTKGQADGYIHIGMPRNKEPADIVGEYVKFYIKKRRYKFTSNGETQEGTLIGLIRLDVL